MALAGEIMRYIGNEFVPMATKTASSSLSSVIPSAITKTGTSLANKAGKGLLNNILVNKIEQTASNYVPVVVNGKISLKNLPGYSEGNNLNLRHISNKEPSGLGVSDLSHQHGGTFFASKKGSKIPVVNGENVYFGNLDNAKVLDLSDSDTALALSKGYKYNLRKTGAFKDSAYPEKEIMNQVMQIQKGKTGSINRGDIIDNLTGGDIVLKGSSDVPTEVSPEFVLTNNDMVKKANFSLGYKRPQGDSISRAKQYINNAKYGLDEYGMGTVDLRDLNTPKVQQSLDDMITLYHNTKAENIPSILEQGLVPGKRPGGYLVSPEEAGIWTDDRGLKSGSYGGTTVKIRVPKKEFDATRVNDTQNLLNRVIKPSEIEGVDYMLCDTPLIKNSNLQEYIDKYGEDKVRNVIEKKGLVSPEVIEEAFSGLGGSVPKVQQSIDVRSSLINKAKNYKSLDRFEKMNNPIKGSEIWGEKPTSAFQRDSRAVRINMFPNDAVKGTGITKQYLLNLLKDAYDQGITDIVPSYGSYTKEGASFMDHLAEQGWVKATGKNGWKSYEIAPKIAEWGKTTPLADIYNEAHNIPEVQQSFGSGGYGSLSDDAKKIGSADVAPIDPETLPGGYDKMRDYLADYKNLVPKAIGKPAGKVTKADLVKLLEDYGYDTEGTKWELWNNAQDALEDEFIDELYENNGEIFARFLGDHRGGAGITSPGQFRLGSGNKANYLDSVLSDRLGIGRSHTPMADSLNKYNKYGMDTAGGDYMTNGIGINLNSWGNEGEGGVSTIAHERMHAWQDQGTGWNYPEEFRDAYTELRKDLEPYFHNNERILKDHPNSNRELEYWARKNEQEARMWQSYLENEGFTKTGRKSEWGDEIKPAFDKFVKKLQSLSKAGFALPAIAGLFGLGAMAGKKEDGKKLDK